MALHLKSLFLYHPKNHSRACFPVCFSLQCRRFGARDCKFIAILASLPMTHFRLSPSLFQVWIQDGTRFARNLDCQNTPALQAMSVLMYTYMYLLHVSFSHVCQDLSPPRSLNRNLSKLLGKPNKLWVSDPGWTSILSRRSRNTPSPFMLQKHKLRYLWASRLQGLSSLQFAEYGKCTREIYQEN